MQVRQGQLEFAITIMHQKNFPKTDEDEGQFRFHKRAFDSSGTGNHLELQMPPRLGPATIDLPLLNPTAASPSPSLQTAAVSFRGNFAINKHVKGMPEK